MRRRSLERRLLKLNGCFLLLRLGMTGLVPRSFNHRPASALSEALSPIRRFDASCGDEPLRDRAVMRFAAGQEDGEKTAPSICACMDLRVAPAS
jgi:hypothetical protein